MEIHWHQNRDKKLIATLVESSVNESGTWQITPLISLSRIPANRVGSANERAEFLQEARARLHRVPMPREQLTRLEAQLAKKLGDDDQISEIDIRWIGVPCLP